MPDGTPRDSKRVLGLWAPDRLRIAVIPANPGGMRFWRRHGFEPVPAVGAHPTAIALERPVAGGA